MLQLIITFLTLSRHSHHLKDWEEEELRQFLCNKDLDYWKLYDSENRSYFYVDEDGDLATNGTSWNDDEMYWTMSGHGCIENKGTGQLPSAFTMNSHS